MKTNSKQIWNEFEASKTNAGGSNKKNQNKFKGNISYRIQNEFEENLQEILEVILPKRVLFEHKGFSKGIIKKQDGSYLGI